MDCAEVLFDFQSKNTTMAWASLISVSMNYYPDCNVKFVKIRRYQNSIAHALVKYNLGKFGGLI